MLVSMDACGVVAYRSRGHVAICLTVGIMLVASPRAFFELEVMRVEDCKCEELAISGHRTTSCGGRKRM